MAINGSVAAMPKDSVVYTAFYDVIVAPAAVRATLCELPLAQLGLVHFPLMAATGKPFGIDGYPTTTRVLNKALVRRASADATAVFMCRTRNEPDHVKRQNWNAYLQAHNDVIVQDVLVHPCAVMSNTYLNVSNTALVKPVPYVYARVWNELVVSPGCTTVSVVE